jgi:Leucine-rich repeat (LRR) protein
MGNRLAALPDGFGALSGLRRLGLKSNGLTQLPASFTQLTNLVELFITDNKLTRLPEGARGLDAGCGSKRARHRRGPDQAPGQPAA